MLWSASLSTAKVLVALMLVPISSNGDGATLGRTGAMMGDAAVVATGRALASSTPTSTGTGGIELSGAPRANDSGAASGVLSCAPQATSATTTTSTLPQTASCSWQRRLNHSMAITDLSRVLVAFIRSELGRRTMLPLSLLRGKVSNR